MDLKRLPLATLAACELVFTAGQRMEYTPYGNLRTGRFAGLMKHGKSQFCCLASPSPTMVFFVDDGSFVAGGHRFWTGDRHQNESSRPGNILGGAIT
jgi:hypothetical protein